MGNELGRWLETAPPYLALPLQVALGIILILIACMFGTVLISFSMMLWFLVGL